MSQGLLWGRGGKAGLRCKPAGREERREEGAVTPQLRDRTADRGPARATARRKAAWLRWRRAFERV